LILRNCSGRDAILLMPTGGGKSMTYLLPSVVPSMGVTVVLSPLVALMREQTQLLRSRGVTASCLWSGAPEGIKTAIFEDLNSPRPQVRVLFCTPEGAAASGRTASALEGLARRRLLRLCAVDEAHCISSWGHQVSRVSPASCSPRGTATPPTLLPLPVPACLS
jgi:bloom syndrome protein